MKKLPLIIILLSVATLVSAQSADKLITEDYVRKVVTTLASDDMNGRSAMKPENAMKAADYIASQFKETGLGYISGMTSHKQEFSVKGVSMANVVGMIKGKTKPDEFVIFSAHYDHVGVIEAVAGDSIANGADDDASGTTAVIALAKYFKALNKNERSLLFVAFSAEEIGGFGSRYFSQGIDPSKVVAMFNIEMIGKLSKWGPNAAFITGFDLSNFGDILQKNLAGTKFTFNADPYIEQQLFYRSDNATLAKLGVPAHSISTDEIDKDQLYHSVDDEVESLNIKNMVEVIKAIALGSTSIVNGQDAPTRIPPLEKGK